MQDFIGQSIGRYHIIERLGEGGMAVVYRAFDTNLECDVAIKFIRSQKLNQDNSAKTLYRLKTKRRKLRVWPIPILSRLPIMAISRECLSW